MADGSLTGPLSVHTLKTKDGRGLSARFPSWQCYLAIASAVSQNVCPLRYMGGEVSRSGLGRSLAVSPTP